MHGRAGKDDLRSLGLAEHVQHVRLDPVTGAVRLARNLLANGQHRFGAAQVHDDVSALETADDAGDDFALAVLVVVEDDFAFGVAGALDDHLLGRLRGDAPEGAAVGLQLEDVAVLLVLRLGGLGVFVEVEDLEDQLVAGFHFHVLGLGLGQGDLVRGQGGIVGEVLDDRDRLEELDRGLVLAVLGFEVPVHSKRLLGRLKNGRLESRNQDFALDAFVLGYLVEDHVEVHCRGRHVPLLCLRGSCWPARHAVVPLC